MKKIIDKINKFFEGRQSLKQFVQFCLVGGSNFLISALTYWGCFYLLHTGEFVAYIAGFLVSVVNAYYWNLVWVFKHKHGSKKAALAKFLAIYTSTFFLGMLINYVFVTVLKQEPKFFPFLNTAITTPINFFLSKMWAFRDKSKVGEK
ncbi:MAG: GtrA family protein [Bacillota bacterium]